MKRVLAIVAIVLSLATVVGVFIVAGGDGSSAAKGTTTTTQPKTNPAKVGTEVIKNAGSKIGNSGTKVQSEPPVVTTDDDDDDDDDDDNKYEAKAAFVGVSPSTVQQGKKVKLELRNFAPNSPVVINIVGTSGSPITKNLVTDKKGRAKWEFTAPAAAASPYSISATGTGGKFDTTTLKVVKKKS